MDTPNRRSPAPKLSAKDQELSARHTEIVERYQAEVVELERSLGGPQRAVHWADLKLTSEIRGRFVTEYREQLAERFDDERHQHVLSASKLGAATALSGGVSYVTRELFFPISAQPGIKGDTFTHAFVQYVMDISPLLVVLITSFTAVATGVGAVIHLGQSRLSPEFRAHSIWRHDVAAPALETVREVADPAVGTAQANARENVLVEKAAQDSPAPPSPRTASVTDVRASLQGLLDEWADYVNNPEQYYLTMPTLHDITGTVPTTVAYQRALADLVAAVDGLHEGSPADVVAAASVLADTAWERWHDAVKHSGEVGLDDRSTEERTALSRLSKLVHRLQNSPASDPELQSIKARIQSCLDKISTVSVSWATIAALPGIEPAVRLQLPRGSESA